MEKKIIDRINKLLALATSPNVNEAESAMEMAQQLMLENNILESDLKAADIENALGNIGDSHTDERIKLAQWEKTLSSVIASKFGSISYTGKRWDNSLYAGKGCFTQYIGFIGHESNRITCQTMYEWLRKLINQKAKEYSPIASQRKSFCYGAVQSLVNRYYQEPDVNELKGNDLVIYDEVRKWADEKMNLTTKKSRLPSVSSGAFAAGKLAGDEMSLNKHFGLKQIGC